MTATNALTPGRRRARSRNDSPNADSITRPIALLLAIAIGLPLLYGGACLLLAGIASYQAQAFLQDWEKKGQEPDARVWQVARDAAQLAIDRYPVANGAYLHRLGLIEQWKQFRQPFGVAEAEGSRRAALQAFRAATEARPNWPEHWSALAHAKLYLLEFDGEFHNALRKAHELGPWRIEINRRLAEIGYLAWPQLNEAERDSIRLAAQRTVAYNQREAQKLLSIAEYAGMIEDLCGSLTPELRTIRKICTLQK